MTGRPPIRRPPPRGHIAGRRRRVVAAVMALLAVGIVIGCRPGPGPAGLLVSSGGALYQLDAGATLVPVPDGPTNVRQVATAGGSTVVVTEDEQYFVASPARPGVEAVTWRRLAIEPPGDQLTTGIDVSPDGRSLAIVRGRGVVEHLDLIVVDLATGESRKREFDVAANGPPSWLTNDTVALEVVTLATELAIASVDLPDGDLRPSESRGFAIASTTDGSRIAVADDSTGSIVVRDPVAWWAGDAGDPGIEPPEGLGVYDLAIDPGGTSPGGRLRLRRHADAGRSRSIDSPTAIGGR